MQSLLILGRQPELGLAELESLYGAEKIVRLSTQAALVDIDPCLLAFKRLGGSLKFAKLLVALDSLEWSDILNFLLKTAPEQVKNMPDGKMTLGLSLYGFNLAPRDISKSGLAIKRAIQKTNRSVRLVPNKAAELNSAQVIHNKLTSVRAWELLIIKGPNKTYIAQTVAVQDIEAYAGRDQVRPSRDARVGMLPPKLAQIIINLAGGQLPADELKSICETDQKPALIPKLDKTILDPFCGSGVILQEASLMGYQFIGSDISPAMVESSRKNLAWLSNHFKLSIDSSNILVGDARKTRWPSFNLVASETSLGKPLASLPLESELNTMIEELSLLIEQSLKNIASQAPTGTRVCLAIPAWQISPTKFKMLPIIDRLTDLGYNSMEFKHVKSRQLIYSRPGQLVGRQLLTLTRK